MNLRQQIIVVADTFAQARGIGRKRVSTLVLNRGSKLDNIATGGDLATGIRWPLAGGYAGLERTLR
ncbi:hypothetical protein BMJ25_30240 [Sinorhizobium medicae]|nr:hypothetical protein BMJ25_30240 [Sinorhizobium medicae]